MQNPASIMVVEDSPRARQALTAYLSQQAGIRVTAEAANGVEAIRLIEQQPPDIILMDLLMPVMDGLEATRTIKKNWPQIKIVAMTVYASYESEALAAGADAFLVKGCSAQEMLATVQALRRGGAGDNFHAQP